MRRLRDDERTGYVLTGVADGYDRWAATYDRDVNPLIAVEEPVVLNLVGDVERLRILDLGCGTGRYCEHLARRGATVTGIDLSACMLEQAARNKPGPALRVIQGKLSSLCLADSQFDLAICALTLSHVQSLEPVFAEATRVLRRDGRIIISDFHPYWVVFGHDYTEFFDAAGQEYRIPCYPHCFEEYWRLFLRFGWRLDDVLEPEIDDELMVRFPSLADYRGVPLALIMLLSRRL
jgi:ubiquinone/menaquinone biosynthesis C-methylase UbiE